MNEQIKNLAIKSGLLFQRENPSYEEKKFAELIVWECIQAVDNVGGYNEEFHMNAIKEHFGVEE
jgi:hypothetical protein